MIENFQLSEKKHITFTLFRLQEHFFIVTVSYEFIPFRNIGIKNNFFVPLEIQRTQVHF